MSREVQITVHNKQTNEQGEQETIEFTTLGNLFIKNRCIYLVYKESEVSGMEGTTTSLKVEPRRVTLNRMGTSEMKQIFEEGLDHQGTYITPYGSFQTRVRPSEVSVDLTEVGGSINLKYELMLDNNIISHNELIITVKEV